MRKESDNATLIIEMDGARFPFGETDLSEVLDDSRRVLVRKRVAVRSERERGVIREKLAIMKGMCHRNLINVRSVEEDGDEVRVYYGWVPLSLEGAFSELSQETFKELHRQLIQLAIHLAKNYILTSFNAARCGGLFVEGKFLIKYFLPLGEIVLTKDIALLERSVQIFKVQAMHLLDTLCHQTPYLDESRSEQRLPLKPHPSQHSLYLSRTRRLSNHTSKRRKFSNLGSNLGKIGREKSQDSTVYTETRLSGLKETLKNFKMQSQRKRTSEKSKQRVKERVELLKVRSGHALRLFEIYKREIAQNMGLSRLVRLCSHPELNYILY